MAGMAGMGGLETPMEIREDWDRIRERFDALWAGEIVDRCCAAVVSWRAGFTDADLAPVDEIRPDDPDDLEDYWNNPERILLRHLHAIGLTYYTGEAFPVICHYYAPAGHAEYFGGSTRYGNGTFWFDPTITDLERQFPRFDPDHPSLKRHLAIYRELWARSDGRYLVSMPDHVGAADALSHLMGPEALMVDIHERPELVAAAIAEINRGWAHCTEAYWQALDGPVAGSSVGWLGTWGRGRHTQMQCDLSVMMSPEDFERLLVPELERQMDWIEQPLYHLDGIAQVRHLDHLLALPRLRMIQWTNVVGQGPPSAYLPELRRIQAAGKGLWLQVQPGDVPDILDALSSRGLFLSVGTETPEEADAILETIAAHTRE